MSTRFSLGSLPPIMGGDETLTAEELDKEIQSRRSRHDDLLAEVQPLIVERRKTRADFETRSGESDESKRPTAEERKAFSDEERSFNESVAEKLAEISSLADQIERDEMFARSLKLAQRASAGTSLGGSGTDVTTREPSTYRRDNQHEISYFLDLAYSQNDNIRSLPNRKADGFQERLDRHAKEIAQTMPKRWAQRKRDAESQVEQADQDTRKRHGLRQEILNESPFHRQEDLYLDHRTAEGMSISELEQRAPSRIVGQGGFVSMAAVAA